MSRNQVSGSISLDLSGMTEVVTADVLTALEGVHAELTRLAMLVTAAPLNEERMAEEIWGQAPARANFGHEHALETAQNLKAAGYALINTGGRAATTPDPSVTAEAQSWLSGIRER